MMNIRLLLALPLLATLLAACAHQKPAESETETINDPLRLSVAAEDAELLKKALEPAATLSTDTPLQAFADGRSDGVIVDKRLSGEELWDIQKKIGRQPLRLFLAASLPSEKKENSANKADEKKENSETDDTRAFNGSIPGSRVFFVYLNPAVANIGQRSSRLWSKRRHDSIRNAGLVPLTPAIAQRNEVLLGRKPPHISGGYD